MSEPRVEGYERGDYAVENMDRHQRRNSTERTKKCVKNIRRISRSYDMTLEIDAKHKTAHINMEKNPNHAVISGRRFPQNVTDYDNEEWDWLCQRVLTLHEGAHGRWTNFDDFKKRLNQVDPEIKGVAKEIWNAAEDGAIEEELRKRYGGVAVAILHFRANLFHENRNKKPEVSVASATISAILDKLAYDSGYTDALINKDADCNFTSENDYELFCDEIYPRVEELRDSVLSEPNSKKRNKEIFDFIEEIEEYLEKSDNDGKSESGQGQSQSGMPDDASNSSGGNSEDAENLKDESSVPEKDDVETDDELEKELSDQLEDESKSSGGSDEEQAGAEENPNEPNSSFDSDTWSSAVDESKRLERVLDDLISSQKSRRKRNQRRGRIDGSSISRIQTGEKRYKMQRSKPKTPDISFAIILDRSGSMRHNISEAEIATAGFALALFEIGIDVIVINLVNSSVETSCPFDTNPSKCKQKLADGKYVGGTPLSKSLDKAVESLRGRSGTKQIIAITDDAPENPSKYKRKLRNCPYPVTGLLIGKSDNNSAQYYNRFVNTKANNLSYSIEQLAREIVNNSTVSATHR